MDTKLEALQDLELRLGQMGQILSALMQQLRWYRSKRDNQEPDYDPTAELLAILEAGETVASNLWNIMKLQTDAIHADLGEIYPLT